MGSLKEDIQKLKDIKKQITDIMARRELCAEEIVRNHAPIKIGDIVEANGYSHTGKNMIVNHVYLTEHFNGTFLWAATGKIIKKDGSSGHNDGKWSQEVDI